MITGITEITACLKSMPKTRKTVTTTLLFLALLWALPSATHSAEPFPRYPVIRDAVQFWKQVYATHSMNAAVIHDRDDLSKVYEVIQLLDKDLPGAERINSAALKQTLARYRNMLTHLGHGNQPVTREEKRVSALFAGAKKTSRMLLAAETIRSQTGQKERFARGVIRSGAYMTNIKQIFLAKGLPVELAYLPHVESSFNTRAYSKFGAAGVWQFTRATGKQYMQINDAVDERRDPLLAAEAAAKYLKNSYMLLGDWPMAITAYNYGTAGMLRAQEAAGTYDKIYTSYSEGHFGFASRNFYSEFLAALEVARDLEKDQSLTLDKPVSFTGYTLPGYLHLSDVLRHFRINEKTVRELNPALREPVYEGSRLIPRGYELRLPGTTRTAKLISTMPRSLFAGSQTRDSLYRVKPGDTALAIALHHNITLTTLLRANALDKDARIYVGQRLRIPASGRDTTKPLLPYLIAEDNKQFANKGQPPYSDAGSPWPILSAGKKRLPTSTPVAKEGVDRDTIIVHPEESLSLYAYWLKLDEAVLRKINRLKRVDSIHPGQEILLQYSKVSAAEFADLRADFARENEADFFSAYKVVDKKFYTVKKGDTLWDICNRKFNIPLWLLKKYNEDLDYSSLRPAQTLTVPMVRER